MKVRETNWILVPREDIAKFVRRNLIIFCMFILDTFSRVNSDLDDENDEENPERIPPIADVEIYQLDQIYEKSKQK